VLEEQRQQQHLDVRAVHVGIGEDDDLPVAQPGEIDVVAGLVVVHTYSQGDGLDLLVGVKRVGAVLPGVLSACP